MFTLTIDPAASPGFGGGRRSGERQQIKAALQAAQQALGNAGQFSGTLRDTNLKPNVDAVNIGSWVYTPQAAGGE